MIIHILDNTLLEIDHMPITGEPFTYWVLS